MVKKVELVIGQLVSIFYVDKKERDRDTEELRAEGFDRQIKTTEKWNNILAVPKINDSPIHGRPKVNIIKPNLCSCDLWDGLLVMDLNNK